MHFVLSQTAWTHKRSFGHQSGQKPKILKTFLRRRSRHRPDFVRQETKCVLEANLQENYFLNLSDILFCSLVKSIYFSAPRFATRMISKHCPNEIFSTLFYKHVARSKRCDPCDQSVLFFNVFYRSEYIYTPRPVAQRASTFNPGLPVGFFYSSVYFS